MHEQAHGRGVLSKQGVLLALALLPSLVGCAGEMEDGTGQHSQRQLGQVDGDSPTEQEFVTSTPELEQVVRSTVERWAAATGRTWEYAGATEQDVGATFHVEFGDPPPGYIAFSFANGRVLVGPEWRGTPELATIVLHELGHAFSGDHHTQSGVMYYGLGDGTMLGCLTEADVAWACSYYECSRFDAECETPQRDLRH